jgi:type IX secretion system PorP/SprF family membrane protein
MNFAHLFITKIINFLKLGLLCFWISIPLSYNLMAQDPQFTQYYRNPVYHNPAMAGSEFMPRISISTRSQWPRLDAASTSILLGADTYFEAAKSGVGIYFLNDRIGERTKTNDLSLQYAYRWKYAKNQAIRIGLGGHFLSSNFSSLGTFFGDQFGNSGANGKPSSDPNKLSKTEKFFDGSAGLLWETPTIQAGISSAHLLTQGGFYRKYQAIASYKINLSERFGNSYKSGSEYFISPSVLYRKIGPVSQMDMGAVLKLAAVEAGLSYRGIPLKKIIKKTPGADAINGMVGLNFDSFTIAYSYDVTVSRLRGTTGGSHEFSLVFRIDNSDYYEKPF